MNLSDVKNMNAFITENEQSLKELVETMVKCRFSFRNLENTVNKAKEYHRIDKLEGKDNGFKMEYLNRGEKSLKFYDGELN